MSDVEGIGGIATGALLARVIEPRTGEREDGHTHESQCLNCGEPLTGPYCARCGQRAHVHRTIVAWWHDFTHSVLHIDGKFWPTLGMLAWRPGDLTRRYAHGERAKFVSPMALFLFTVFSMFAVFSLAGGPFDNSTTAERAEADIQVELTTAEAEVDALLAERSALASSGGNTEAVDERLADARRELRAIQSASALVVVPNSAPEGQTRTVNLRDSEFNTGVPWLDSAFAKARDNPELLLYKMQANAYKFSWALIPLSLPFLWALFLHRRRYREEFTGYDHLVFVTYSIAFMSLALVVLSLLGAAGIPTSLTMPLFMLIMPIHIFRQLRGAYGLSRFSAAWRTVAVLLFAGIALLLFLLLLLAIGVMG